MDRSVTASPGAVRQLRLGLSSYVWERSCLVGSVPFSCGSYGGASRALVSQGSASYVKAVLVRKGMLGLVVFRHGQFWQLSQVMLRYGLASPVLAVRLSRVELRNVVDRQGSCGERRTNNEEIFLE